MPACAPPSSRAGRRRVAYLEANTEVRLQPVKACPDCYPERLGATIRRARAGAGRLRRHPARRAFRAAARPLPEFTLFGG